MATTAMNTYSFSILVKAGIHPPVTMTENGGEVFPGHAVTCTGQTWPDVGLPDGLGDGILGIAGLLENQDIGTVYTDNDEIPIYLCGSGAQVRAFHDGNSGGAVDAGDILVAQAANGKGHLRTLRKALGDALVTDPTNTVLATALEHFFSLVGRSMETLASTGTTTPFVVMLSI